MQGGVISYGHDTEILDTIVLLVAVNVVYLFTAAKDTPKMCFHYHPVLKAVLLTFLVLVQN